MLDAPEEPQFQMINTYTGNNNNNFGQRLTEQSAALQKNPSLSADQMRMIEEKRMQALARKRKSEAGTEVV